MTRNSGVLSDVNVAWLKFTTVSELLSLCESRTYLRLGVLTAGDDDLAFAFSVSTPFRGEDGSGTFF